MLTFVRSCEMACLVDCQETKPASFLRTKVEPLHVLYAELLVHRRLRWAEPALPNLLRNWSGPVLGAFFSECSWSGNRLAEEGQGYKTRVRSSAKPSESHRQQFPAVTQNTHDPAAMLVSPNGLRRIPPDTHPQTSRQRRCIPPRSGACRCLSLARSRGRWPARTVLHPGLALPRPASRRRTRWLSPAGPPPRPAAHGCRLRLRAGDPLWNRAGCGYNA